MAASTTIGNNGALTIPAGTVLRFPAGAILQINQGGSLASLGTAAAPVFFTGLQATPGFWRGVWYYSNSTANQLTHTVVEHAGGGAAGTNNAAVYVEGASSAPARIKLNQVTVRASQNYGFFFTSNVSIDEFEGVRSTANARAGFVQANDLGLLTTSSSYVGNERDAIDAGGSTISRAQTWRKLDVPYHLSQQSVAYTVQGALAIEAGTTVRFGSGASMVVSQSGSLSAIGTAQAPITFTGLQQSPGSWAGIEIRNSNNINNELRFATVEYGGVAQNDANIYVNGASSAPARLKLTNVTLQQSNGHGLYASANVTLDNFVAVKSTNNRYAAYLSASVLHYLGSDSDFAGNGAGGDYVFTSSDTVSGNRTWSRLNVPYFLNPTSANIEVTGALTLQPGVSLLMGSGTGINVRQAGSFTANGTAAAPISIRGAQSSPGYWRGIDFQFSNSSANQIANAVISDGGGGGSGRGNLTLTGASSAVTTMSVTNSTFTNSAGWGIYRTTNVNLTQSGNTFTGNASGTVN
jgi:hypothetical protein